MSLRRHQDRELHDDSFVQLRYGKVTSQCHYHVQHGEETYPNALILVLFEFLKLDPIKQIKSLLLEMTDVAYARDKVSCELLISFLVFVDAVFEVERRHRIFNLD